MGGSFNTGMPEGNYCNVNAGDVIDNKCTGKMPNFYYHGLCRVQSITHPCNFKHSVFILRRS